MQRRIVTLPFTLTGAGTTITYLDLYDLSRSFENKSELILTTANTGAGDELDVKFQETSDGVQWNTRMRHTAMLGTLSPSSTAPESEILTILSLGPLPTTDQIREPTGSAGATELTAPGVIHGYLTGRMPDRTPAYRVVMTVTETTSASFAGTWILWIDSPID